MGARELALAIIEKLRSSGREKPHNGGVACKADGCVCETPAGLPGKKPRG